MSSINVESLSASNGSTAVEQSLSEYQEILLSEAALVLRAPLIKSEKTSGGIVYNVLTITDILEYGHIIHPTKIIRLDKSVPKAEKYRLQPFDVIVSIVGSVGKICMIPETAGNNWVPTSNMLVIRFREQKVASALAFSAFMKSPHGEKILKDLTHGNKIPMISKKEFMKIHVPSLTPEVQRRAEAVYRQEEKLISVIENSMGELRNVRAGYLSSKR